MKRQTSSSTVSFRQYARRCLYAAAILLVGTTSVANGQGKKYQVDLSKLGFGRIDQNGPNITLGDYACGPTSAINSFFFLQTQYKFTTLGPGKTPLTNDNAWEAINEISGLMNIHAPIPEKNDPGGVWDDDFVKGKKDYLKSHDLGGRINVEYQSTNPALGGTTPTWTWLYEQLQAKQDVEVLFGKIEGDPADALGHWVTATSFKFTDKDADGAIDKGEKATMGFIDPSGGVALIGSLEMMAGNYLKLTYPDGANWGRIMTAVAESPYPSPGGIPEPSTYGLCGALVLILGVGTSRILRNR